MTSESFASFEQPMSTWTCSSVETDLINVFYVTIGWLFRTCAGHAGPHIGGGMLAGGAAAAVAAYGAHHLMHSRPHGHFGHHGHYGHHGKFKHGKFKHGKFGKHGMFGKHKRWKWFIASTNKIAAFGSCFLLFLLTMNFCCILGVSLLILVCYQHSRFVFVYILFSL